MDFDWMSDMMNETSKSHMNTDVMVDIELIDPFDFNEEVYPSENDVEHVNELAALIKREGLLHPVLLIYNPEDKKRYISISGNKRCEAIRQLVFEQGLEEFRMVKAVVIEDMTEDEAKIRCITANTQREKSSYSKIKEVQILQNIAKGMQEQGKELDGGLRLWIANRSEMKPTQVGKMQRIINKGTEELEAAIKKDVVTLEAAAEIASLSEEKQKEMVEMIAEHKITNTEAEEIAKQVKKDEKIAKKTKKDEDKSNEKLDEVIKQEKIEKMYKKIEKELNNLLKIDTEHRELIEQLLTLVETRTD